MFSFLGAMHQVLQLNQILSIQNKRREYHSLYIKSYFIDAHYIIKLLISFFFLNKIKKHLRID